MYHTRHLRSHQNIRKKNPRTDIKKPNQIFLHEYCKVMQKLQRAHKAHNDLNLHEQFWSVKDVKQGEW